MHQTAKQKKGLTSLKLLWEERKLAYITSNNRQQDETMFTKIDYYMELDPKFD